MLIFERPHNTFKLYNMVELVENIIRVLNLLEIQFKKSVMANESGKIIIRSTYFYFFIWKHFFAQLERMVPEIY